MSSLRMAMMKEEKNSMYKSFLQMSISKKIGSLLTLIKLSCKFLRYLVRR